MIKLSKKEKFREEKRLEKRNKKIINYSILILIFISLSYFIINSAMNIPKFNNPNVNQDEVPNGAIHWHPTLIIKINGENQIIPNNIGLAPGKHSPIHTHEEGDGTIHIENMNPKSQPETMSLGYFFNQWKKPFNETCILDKCTNIDGGELKMFVNDKQNFEFEKYIFKGEEKIVIEYNN